MNKLFAAAAAAIAFTAAPAFAQPTDILNASYDIARELFEAENAAYAASGAAVTVNQSHAGSSAQARAVLEGLPADVVTFNQVVDIEKLVTVVRFRLDRDGRLIGNPTVVSQSGITPSNEAQKGRHAEQAIRAIRLAAPFDLPAEFYDQWKTVNSQFDRRLSQ